MKKETIYVVQGLLSAAGAYISGKLGILFPVLVAVCFMMTVDQLSGMMASKKEALDHPGDSNYGWSSTKWRKGLYKKLGYILTIAVAMMVDYIIFTVSETAGITLPIDTMFGLLTIIWFIINEALSILENAGRMGAQLPDFLVNVLAVLKDKVETSGEEGISNGKHGTM